MQFLVELAIWLVEAFADKEVAELIAKFVGKHLGEKAVKVATTLKKAKKLARQIETFTDPTKILKALVNAPLKERQKFLNELKKKNKEQYKKVIDEQEKKDENYVALSSSWVQYGKWVQTNRATNTGNLTIKICRDNDPLRRWYGPYTFPFVSRSTWELMKAAKGKNGTGAGKVFWIEFLHTWLPSNLRGYVKKNFKGASKAEIDDANNYIVSLEKRYSRTKAAGEYKKLKALYRESYSSFKKETREQIENSFQVRELKKGITSLKRTRKVMNYVLDFRTSSVREVNRLTKKATKPITNTLSITRNLKKARKSIIKRKKAK